MAGGTHVFDMIKRQRQDVRRLRYFKKYSPPAKKPEEAGEKKMPEPKDFPEER